MAPKKYQAHWFTWKKKNLDQTPLRPRIRAALHYGGEVHRSWILGDSWILIGREWHSCSGGGLHYNKESFGGELCPWMKEWHACQHGDTFLKGSFVGVRFLGQPQSLGQETWPPKNSNSDRTFFLILYLLWHSIPCLKQPSLALTNWCTSPP